VTHGTTLHPDLTAEERRRLILRGVELFNRGEFFEAHEAWEEVWRSTTPEPRDLFQGLVQVAAALHHAVDRGKPTPARRVLARGRRRLVPLAPAACGLDLAALLTELDRWDRWLAAGEGERPPLPKIRVADLAAVG